MERNYDYGHPNRFNFGKGRPDIEVAYGVPMQQYPHFGSGMMFCPPAHISMGGFIHPTQSNVAPISDSQIDNRNGILKNATKSKPAPNVEQRR